MSIKDALRADKTGNAAIAKALADATPTLQTGANEKAVRWLERMLVLAGFNPGTRDNKFTAATSAALKQFQAARGLPATGVLDLRTFEHLKLVQKRARANHGKNLFGVGQKNEFIKTAERRLRALGYDTGKVDGVLDRQTASAIKQFRKDEKLKGGGVVTERLQQELRGETKALDHKAYRGRTQKNLKEHRRLDALTGKEVAKTRSVPRTHADGSPVLDANGQPVVDKLTGVGLGDKGRAVRNIQWHLRAAGYDPNSLSGRFDTRTEAALEAFQRENGLKVTGRVGPGTWKKLAKSVIYARGDASPAHDLGERSSAVLRSEKMLKKLGLNPGKVDGLFDRATLKASRAFERMMGAKGNQVDGAIGTGQLRQMKKALQGVTPSQLRRIMPTLPMSKATQYAPLINRAMAEAGITTHRRKAMFLAQLAHESGGLRYFEELASGAAYEGRRDLGNVRPGDGVRYKGRGPIQLTGRANYRAAGRALGLPLEAKPRLASRPSIGFRIAAWFWKSRGLNAIADTGNFREVTRRINGGYNGLADRLAYYRRALRAL